MDTMFAQVTHEGPLVKILGRLPSTSKALMPRAGAFEQDGMWVCTTQDWARVETVLRAMGVTMSIDGRPQVFEAPAAPNAAVEASVSLTSTGALRIQGKLPKPMRKEWLGSDRQNGHVGMSPWALPDFIREATTQGIVVTVNPGAQILIDDVRQRMTDIDRITASGHEVDVRLASGALRDYQRRSLAFAQACSGRFLNAHEVGLGKTAVALGWKRFTKAKRVVVLCPAIAKGNWRDEIRKFDGDSVTILDGFPDSSKTSVPNVTWVITNYDTLSGRSDSVGWLDALIRFKPDLVVADESHICKNRQSQRGEAVKRLAHSVPHFIPMSGTAMSNSPMDLWNQLDAIQPGYWGTAFEFGIAFAAGQQRYGRGGVKFWDFKGVSNTQTLSKMLRYAMIRYTKDEVLTSLPSQTRIPYRMDLLPGHRLEYQSIMREYREFIEDIRSRSESSGDEKDLLEAAQGKRMAFMMRMRQVSSRGRIQGTSDLILNLIDQGKRPVVFAYFTEALHGIRDTLKEAGIKVGFIDGSTSRVNRDQAREDFCAGKSQVLIGQIEAMGVAINLQEASDITVTHELTYRPVDVIQSEARIMRSGQKYPVTHYYCIGEDTRDDRILEAVLAKMTAMRSILDGDGGDVTKDVLHAFEVEFFRNPNPQKKLAA